MRRRIIICLGILLALCLAGDTTAIVFLSRNTRELARLVDSHRVQSMRVSLSTGAVRLEQDLLDHFSAPAEAAPISSVHTAQFERLLNHCGTCHHVPAIQAKLDGIRSIFSSYQSTLARYQAAPEATGLRADAINVATRIVDDTTSISDQAMDHLAFRTSLVAKQLTHARRVLWATCAAALVFGGFVAFHLHQRLTRPIADLLNGIERVRQGDVEHRLSIEADPEFRKLGQAFNQAYDRLSDAQEGAIQAEKMAAVGKMAAGVAHEVNNPLASISSIAQLMRRRLDSEEEREQIDLIMGQIARISRIVRDLLTFSRPAQIKEHGNVPVDELIEHATTLLGYDDRSRDIRVVQELDSELGMVRGDSDRLLLVFTNIMINAFDAIDQADNGQPGMLKIAARRDGECVTVRFEDNGPGMTEDQVANAFEPFYTTKEPSKGTGLGLWICYQIIGAHNGSIQIGPRNGRGTVVKVSLPSTKPPGTTLESAGAQRAPDHRPQTANSPTA